MKCSDVGPPWELMPLANQLVYTWGAIFLRPFAPAHPRPSVRLPIRLPLFRHRFVRSFVGPFARLVLADSPKQCNSSILILEQFQSNIEPLKYFPRASVILKSSLRSNSPARTLIELGKRSCDRANEGAIERALERLSE